MAKILGESGRYMVDETVRQRRRIIGTCCVVIAILGAIVGMLVASTFPLTWLPPWLKSLLLIFLLIGMWCLDKWGLSKIDTMEKQRDKIRRGAAGEIKVGSLLSDLPAGFCVINDLSTENGNIDHVVIGPTGVFALDAKAWRGVVASDRNAELLLNGRPTDKPYVRQFVGRMMGIRQKVLTLAPGHDARFNAVFVFTAARVEAKWGTTGNLNCITDDQLYDYIVEKDFGKKLTANEINTLAQAFSGVAHMDKDFRPNFQGAVAGKP